MRHIMSPLDFSVEELDQMMDLAADIEKHPEKYAHACDGKKIATLFYEPSTRTRLSFETAMLNLGGSVIGFASADSSSASKGESVSDTIRVISCFADICAMRHPKGGRSSRSLVCFFDSSHQRRGRRSSASHPDINRSAYHTVSEGTAGPSDHRTLRRSEIRTYRSFADQRAGALSGCEIRSDFSGGA